VPRIAATATIVRWLRTHRETQWERGIRTFELFIRIASRGEGEWADKLFKANFAVVVSVKGAEEVFRELARITGGEESLVEASEFLLVKPAVRRVLLEIFVPVYASIGGSGQGERGMSIKDAIGLVSDAYQELSSFWLTVGNGSQQCCNGGGQESGRCDAPHNGCSFGGL